VVSLEPVRTKVIGATPDGTRGFGTVVMSGTRAPSRSCVGTDEGHVWNYVFSERERLRAIYFARGR
jgi:hypothetical protein